MTTPFNLQPPTKNTNTASKREEPQQLLHVEIQGVYAKEIAPYIAPLQAKIKWYGVVEKVLAVLFLILSLWLISDRIIDATAVSKVPHSVSYIINAINILIILSVIIPILTCGRMLISLIKPKGFIFRSKWTESVIGNDYQNLVVKPLLKKFKLSLNIEAEGEFPQDIYKKSKLFTEVHETYFSTEVVTDKLQRELAIGYVRTQYTTGSGKSRQVHTIFSGLMACIPCPKSAIGQTFILPDEFEKLLGGFAKQGQGMTNHAGAKLVTMDNPDFEKAFQVYTTESVQAHYLLSTKWLEKLTDFQRELKVPISIALHSGMCYVALHGYESPFTPQQDLEKALTASGVYSQYIRLKKLFDQLEILQQIGE